MEYTLSNLQKKNPHTMSLKECYYCQFQFAGRLCPQCSHLCATPECKEFTYKKYCNDCFAARKESGVDRAPKTRVGFARCSDYDPPRRSIPEITKKEKEKKETSIENVAPPQPLNYYDDEFPPLVSVPSPPRDQVVCDQTIEEIPFPEEDDGMVDEGDFSDDCEVDCEVEPPECDDKPKCEATWCIRGPLDEKTLAAQPTWIIQGTKTVTITLEQLVCPNCNWDLVAQKICS